MEQNMIVILGMFRLKGCECLKHLTNPLFFVHVRFFCLRTEFTSMDITCDSFRCQLTVWWMSCFFVHITQWNKIFAEVAFNNCRIFSKREWKAVFSGDRFFWGNRRKYFAHIPGHRLASKLCFLKNKISKSIEHFSFFHNID